MTISKVSKVMSAAMTSAFATKKIIQNKARVTMVATALVVASFGMYSGHAEAGNSYTSSIVGGLMTSLASGGDVVEGLVGGTVGAVGAKVTGVNRHGGVSASAAGAALGGAATYALHSQNVQKMEQQMQGLLNNERLSFEAFNSSYQKMLSVLPSEREGGNLSPARVNFIMRALGDFENNYRAMEKNSNIVADFLSKYQSAMGNSFAMNSQNHNNMSVKAQQLWNSYTSAVDFAKQKQNGNLFRENLTGEFSSGYYQGNGNYNSRGNSIPPQYNQW